MGDRENPQVLSRVGYFEVVEHEHAHAAALGARSKSSPASSGEEEKHRVTAIAMDEEDTDETQTKNRLCDPFLEQFASMMNQKNMTSILREQDHMLGTLEVANEKLASLNDISERNFQQMSAEFRQNTRTLVTMKKELDSVFRRIRSLKTKLATQYPEAYAAAQADRRPVEDEDEDEDG